MVSTTNFPAEVVPQAPEDPLFGLARAYKADNSPNKIDLVSRSFPTQPFYPKVLQSMIALANLCFLVA
jgi:aspartate aminotransferase